jgi:uncharacterized membrane protein
MPLSYQPFAEAPEIEKVERHLSQNVGSGERLVSGVLGAALVVTGVARRGLGGLILAALGGALVYRGVTGRSELYAALDVNSRDRGVPGNRGIKVERIIDIQVPRSTVFQYWRNLGNLPEFMKHVKRVRVSDDKHSHWVVQGPAGMSLDWDAEIVNEHENELISWQSLPGADVENAGSVRFEDLPGGGTRLRVVLEFYPPAGELGAAVAKLLGESPEQQLQEDLTHFAASSSARKRQLLPGWSGRLRFTAPT